MAKEQWLDPWCEQFYSHTRPIQEARKTKDSAKTVDAIQEHLPEMISLRNEVAALPYPYGFGPGLFKSLFNLCLGIKKEDVLEIERSATIKVWDQAIGDAQRDLRKLATDRR